MQALKKFYFGKQKAKVNTYIGGIGGTINTPALLAAKLGISDNRIKLFKVTGVDVECAIIGSYNLNANLRTYGCTYYESTTATSQSTGQEWTGGNQLKKVILPNMTYARGATFYGNYGIRIYYCPIATNIGEYDSSNVYVGVGGRTRTFEAIQSGFKLYCNPSLATANNGNPVADITTILSRGGIVRYVTNFTPPNIITNLSTGTIYNTAVQLNFTPPTSVNGVDFYEVYINGERFNSKEIKNSGEFITGLTPSTNYNIRIVAVDMFYNKSELSNTVNVSTTNNQSLQGRTLGYFRLNSSTIDQKGFLTDTPNNITYSSGVSGNSAVFNGINSKISSSNVPLTVGSISCWIKTANAGASYRGIFTKQFAFGIFLNNNKVSLYDWGADIERATNVSVNNNTWRHIALTFQSGVVNGTKVYIDGVLVLTTTISVSSQSSNIEIGNGGSASTGQFFTGSIDSVGLFDSILTEPEVILLRDTGLAGNEFI